MSARTAILALFVGFFLLITKISSQGAASLATQVDQSAVISASLQVGTSSRTFYAPPEHGFQIREAGRKFQVVEHFILELG